MTLGNQKLKYKLSIMYALMTIIPVLFFIYLIMQAIFPSFKVAELNFSSIQTSLIIGVIATVLMSLGGLLIMYRSLSSIQTLAQKTDDMIKDRSFQGIKLETLVTNDESEKITHFFTNLLLELQNKMNQANQFAKDLADVNRKLVQLALKDGLTDLYNQTYIKERLSQEVARALMFNHSLGVVMMDLDNFKAFNDTYGHLSGDEALKRVSTLIFKNIRPIDIPARYGGEEFLLIMPETADSTIIDIVERIRKEIAEELFPVSTSEKVAHVTISLGIALYPKNGTDAETLIKQADEALYQAKRAGKNRYVTK